MLIRQKCLLYMVEGARRPVSRLELTKWAFLLAHEMPSGGGSSFYDFVPYDHGPFSFALYRELSHLVRDGYLEEHGETSCRRVADVDSGTVDLPRSVQEDTARVVERFEKRSTDSLLRYVYAEYPWYTINSARKRLTDRPVGPMAVHVVGYERWSVDRFLNELLRNGIVRIIDVRSNPVARKYGFHKRTLAGLAAKLDIAYVHFPELGVSSSERRQLTCPGDYRRLFHRYVQQTLPKEEGAVQQVIDMITEKPSVLMCTEADPAFCHRTHLAKVVSGKSFLPVNEIRGSECVLVSSLPGF